MFLRSLIPALADALDRYSPCPIQMEPLNPAICLLRSPAVSFSPSPVRVAGVKCKFIGSESQLPDLPRGPRCYWIFDYLRGFLWTCKRTSTRTVNNPNYQFLNCYFPVRTTPPFAESYQVTRRTHSPESVVIRANGLEAKPRLC